MGKMKTADVLLFLELSSVIVSWDMSLELRCLSCLLLIWILWEKKSSRSCSSQTICCELGPCDSWHLPASPQALLRKPPLWHMTWHVYVFVLWLKNKPYNFWMHSFLAPQYTLRSGSLIVCDGTITAFIRVPMCTCAYFSYIPPSLLEWTCRSLVLWGCEVRGSVKWSLCLYWLKTFLLQ